MAEPTGSEERRLRVTPVRAVAASLAVAAVAGLSIGVASKPEPLNREEVRRQALSDSGEATLVARLFARLADWTSDDAIVYHWTDYEVRMLASAAERPARRVRGRSMPTW